MHTDLYDNLEVIPFDKIQNFFSDLPEVISDNSSYKAGRTFVQLPITCQMKISLGWPGLRWFGPGPSWKRVSLHRRRHHQSCDVLLSAFSTSRFYARGIVNQRVTDSWKILKERRRFLNENRRSIKLRLHIKRHMDLEIKKCRVLLKNLRNFSGNAFCTGELQPATAMNPVIFVIVLQDNIRSV